MQPSRNGCISALGSSMPILGALGCCTGNVESRRAVLLQLPRPARAPGHLDPQPGPVRRHPRHCANAGRADQRPAGSLPPDRRPDPADAEVARTPPGHPSKHQVRARTAYRISRNFGLTRPSAHVTYRSSFWWRSRCRSQRSNGFTEGGLAAADGWRFYVCDPWGWLTLTVTAPKSGPDLNPHGPDLQRCDSRDAANDISAGQELVMCVRGPTQPIAPYRAINYSAEVSL